LVIKVKYGPVGRLQVVSEGKKRNGSGVAR